MTAGATVAQRGQGSRAEPRTTGSDQNKGPATARQLDVPDRTAQQYPREMTRQRQAEVQAGGRSQGRSLPRLTLMAPPCEELPGVPFGAADI